MSIAERSIGFVQKTLGQDVAINARDVIRTGVVISLLACALTSIFDVTCWRWPGCS